MASDYDKTAREGSFLHFCEPCLSFRRKAQGHLDWRMQRHHLVHRSRQEAPYHFRSLLFIESFFCQD